MSSKTIRESEATTRPRRCEHSRSRELPGSKNAPPGPRGACAKESRSQGSE